jgi:hypothetical protein
MAIEIDHDKYDRQLRTYGYDASKLIQSSTVYIIGLNNNYVSEICKNLALTGINTLYLIGNDINTSNCMWYKDSHNKLCFDILKDNIIKLNNTINVIQLDELEKPIMNSCVVIINKSLGEAKEINKFVRFHNSKTVYLLSKGLAGTIFVDCNVNHIVKDKTGELKEDTVVKNIESNGKIICSDHNFSINDKVKFINLKTEGLNKNYLNQVFTVLNTTPFSVTLCDENMKWIEDDYKFINGTLQYVENKYNFYHFEMNNNIPLLAHDLDKQSSNYVKFTSNYTFTPVVSIMGGLVSNEVIKLVSNKYTPISQWFEWSDFEIIKNYDSQETVDAEIKQIYEKLNDSNILLVGCGALGCEWMKHIAMMGAKSLTIVDPDHI